MPQNPAAPLLSLIIPAYNESEIIVRNVEDLIGWMDGNVADAYSWELIIVDDGSRDNMADLVEAKSAEEPRLRLQRHVANLV